MKNLRILFLVVLCVALTSASGYTKDVGKPAAKQFHRFSSFASETPELGVYNGPVPVSAQAGTTWLGTYSFDSGASCVDQGWVTADITVQPMEHWHVDDFAGLAGGSYGLLYPLEGNQSFWCGARPDASSLLLCGYGSLPGYGNNWDQLACSPCFSVSGEVELTYLIAWDSEPGYDGTEIEIDNCDDNWATIASTANSRNGDVYDGFSPVRFDTVTVSDTLHTGSVRFRFHFTSDGGWSDQDGIWNTDGAIILDSLVVKDGTGQISYEDFESAAVGDNGSGDWNSCNMIGYGDYAALYPGLQLLQEDPCFTDLDCMWSFFTGSSATYACGGYPATLAVPYVNTRNQYIQNHIYSPVLPWVGTGSVGELTFNVYRDLPLDNLVFYEWRIRSWHSGCPSPWLTDWGVYFGPNKDWFGEIFPFGSMVEVGATDIQLAIGARDMCGFWCGIVGTGACHSHAPLVDAVQIYRVALQGPQWQVDDFSLFQDNFATDGTVTGTVRIDAAEDILPRTSAGITPGDSSVVLVTDPVAGLAADAYTGFGAAVYGYVRVDPPQPSKTGHAFSEDPFRFPVVDSVLSTSGDWWYVVRMDTSFGLPGRDAAISDEFCLDLNDNLLTPGDTLWFFLGAKSADGAGSWSYYFHEPIATDNIGVGAVLATDDINVAMVNATEMTCLPAAGLEAGNDILYVDDASGRGVQPYYDSAFDQLGIMHKVDRYDVRRPDSNVGNGLGSRVQNVAQQLIPWYKKILWNSTNLNDGLIGDGVAANEKSNDFGTLYAYIDQSNRAPGLWISGDYNATEWASLASADAVALRSAYMNFGVQTLDHKSVGLPVSPLVVGASGGIFDNITGPDSMVAYGGCNLINEFDVLQQQGASVEQAYYDGNLAYPAILSQATVNAGGSTARVVLSGFSYHYIRDDRAAGIMDRVFHVKKILAFLENQTQEPTGVKPSGYAYSLSQNYPNPFNPTTTINYTLKEQGDVTLRIYNVAGQLIRTLVEATRTPGEVHTATWDGRNDAGQSVSSGVYFYKLVAGSYVQTKKMVLLK
jgi:hypothetical protein